MFTIKQDNGKHIKVVSDAEVDTTSAVWVGFMKDLGAVTSVVALSSYTVHKTDGQYVYVFVAQDGRVWTQNIQIHPTAESHMTYDVPDFWMESEFEHHRSLRLSMSEMVRKYGVTKIEITFP